MKWLMYQFLGWHTMSSALFFLIHFTKRSSALVLTVRWGTVARVVRVVKVVRLVRVVRVIRVVRRHD